MSSQFPLISRGADPEYPSVVSSARPHPIRTAFEDGAVHFAVTGIVQILDHARDLLDALGFLNPFQRWSADLPVKARRPAPYHNGENRRQLGNPLRRSELSQAEVIENKDHHHYETNKVDDAVHVVSFLFA
jgi:hypothetical protein